MGDEAAEKYSIFMPLMDNTFRFGEAAKNLGVLIRMKKIEIQTKLVKLAVWNLTTNDLDLFRMYLKNAEGAILVYNTNSRLSFRRLSEWLMNIHKNSKSYVKIAMVGKIAHRDEKREISYDEGENFSDQYPSIIIFEELNTNEGEKAENLIRRLTQAMIREKNIRNRS